MKKNNILVILAIFGLIGFMTLGVSNARDKQDLKRLHDVQLQDRSTKIKVLELKEVELQQNVEKQKAQTTQDADKIKQLEAEKAKLDEDRKRLEAELQAKLQRKEAERVAAANARNKLTNAVTGTKTASAATPGGSGCAWLRGVLSQHGINGADLNAAINIAQKESGCRQNAVNKSGGACNVFQELPCGKWGGSSNLSGHIRGADSYAKNRYGGWQGAWSAWQAKNWW